MLRPGIGINEGNSLDGERAPKRNRESLLRQAKVAHTCARSLRAFVHLGIRGVVLERERERETAREKEREKDG